MRSFVKICAGSAMALAVAAGCVRDTSPADPPLSDAETPTVPREAALPPAYYSAARIPSSGPAESRQQTVSIDNFAFTPAMLTVSAGTMVTWVNHDDVPHTVTANDKRFGSKALDTDDRYSRVFAAPGTYSYFCAVHPHMTGQIIVK